MSESKKDYVLVAHSWRQILSKPGEHRVDVKHKQGDVIALTEHEAEHLLAAGAIALYDGTVPTVDANQAPADNPDAPTSSRVQDILAWVGSDKARAAEALEAERAAKGDNARATLVGPLEELLTSPDADADGDGDGEDD